MNPKGTLAIAAGAARGRRAGVAVYAGQYPTAQIYGETIHRERGAGKRIALTYDDGPNPEQTPRLLELLARYDAKATFFLIGGWAEREPELIRQTVAAGHAIGNHTYTHPTMPAHGAAADPRGAAALPRGGRGLGRALLHRRRRRADAPALRAPAAGHAADDARGGLRAGHVVDHRLRLARSHHRQGDHPPCLRSGEGDIILLHDGSNDRAGRRPHKSIETTEAVLDHFVPQGFQFVTVPELVAAAR